MSSIHIINYTSYELCVFICYLQYYFSFFKEIDKNSNEINMFLFLRTSKILFLIVFFLCFLLLLKNNIPKIFLYFYVIYNEKKKIEYEIIKNVFFQKTDKNNK